MTRVHIVVLGKVQGVYFRQSTRQQALALGVSGWVRNRNDGSVEVVAEGPEAAIERFVAWHSGWHLSFPIGALAWFLYRELNSVKK